MTVGMAKEFLAIGWFVLIGLIVWGLCLAVVCIIIVAIVATVKSFFKGGKKNG